ncbi:MAG: hypothetical protein IT429_19525 [Gemmataceae bacterium]|nr:hypothetical protein [Gemmataceae bacterium]
MHRHTGPIILTLALALAVGRDAVGRQAAGKPFEKVVAEQKEAAEANWKRVFGKAPLEQVETKHLLVYGKAVPGDFKDFKEVAAALQQACEDAHKVLDLGKEPTWPGKLAVYLVPDRREFRAAVRGIERRMPEEAERGTYAIRSDMPHVLAGPPVTEVGLNVEGQAAAQIAAALLRVKLGVTPPDWLAEGFGRATAYHSGAQRDGAAERRRANSLIVTGKRATKDAWGNNLKADEAPVVRGSLIEYLAYSGRTSRFLPIVLGLRPVEARPNPTPEAAFAAANVSPDRLTELWHRWVRSTLK